MKMKTLACSVALLATISLALPAGAAEKLVVGTEANGIPISFLNPKTHELYAGYRPPGRKARGL